MLCYQEVKCWLFEAPLHPLHLLVENTRSLFTSERGREEEKQTWPQQTLQFQWLWLLSLPPGSLLQTVQDTHVHHPANVPVGPDTCNRNSLKHDNPRLQGWVPKFQLRGPHCQVQSSFPEQEHCTQVPGSRGASNLSCTMSPSIHHVTCGPLAWFSLPSWVFASRISSHFQTVGPWEVTPVHSSRLL